MRQILIPKLESVLKDPEREKIRGTIKEEFREAMTSQIVPELERLIKGMLTAVKEPVLGVNKALYEKLVHEETRSDYMVQCLQAKLNQLT